MRLPPNFARQPVRGQRNKTWAVRIGDRAFVLAMDAHARKPGIIRKRIETALGITHKAKRSAEEIVTAKARHAAHMKRRYRNKLADGTATTPPWRRPRTLSVIVNEERALNIANRWQRMGEFR